VRALPSRVPLTVEEGVRTDEVYVQIRHRDGRLLEAHVPHPSGTVANPMTDEQLRRKFHLLVDPILGQDRATSIVAAFRRNREAPFGSDIDGAAREPTQTVICEPGRALQVYLHGDPAPELLDDRERVVLKPQLDDFAVA
jgi:hypothetical protein